MPGVLKAKHPYSYYDFANLGDLQGWTNIGGGSDYFDVGGDGRSPSTGYNVDNYVGPWLWANRDASTSTNWLRSPVFKFQIPNDGKIIMYLAGGSHGSPYANESEVPTGDGAIADGFTGVLLRDVATGNFVGSAQRGTNGTAWIPKVIDGTAFIGDGKEYTVDILDTDTGSWGWIGVSRVRIPGC